MSKVNSGYFFLQWVTAVAVTMVVVMMGGFMFMWSVGEWVSQAWGDMAGGFVAGGILGASLGAGAGLGQAFVLRSHGISFKHWLGQTVLASAIGMAMGFVLLFGFFGMDHNVPESVVGLTIALSAGLPIGLVQWQMLKTHVAQAPLWILICITAFFIGPAVGIPLGGEGREMLSVSVVALLIAVVSGAGIVWLVRGGETAVAV